ncbi:MAG TPA: anti-sigma factor [Micromonosporaceae bacterium]|nr:anti-sigma factor [Micromonosporaceae bacterium]
MKADECDKEILSLYAFEALSAPEREPVQRHLSSCAACRAELAELEEVTNMLGELPPEALLHGPPAGGDLVLQRTLRTMRAEESGMQRRRALVRVAAAAAVIGVALAGGVVFGRTTAPQPDPIAVPTLAPTVAGTRKGETTDPVTNARLAATMVPAAGWVRVNVSVAGITAGENCRVIVVSRNGTREIAAGWIVSEKGQREGTTLDGAAAVAPADVVAIEVENTSGKKFVSLKI